MCPGGSDRPASYESIPKVMQDPPLNGGSNLIMF
jgi:hypothetical protein